MADASGATSSERAPDDWVSRPSTLCTTPKATTEEEDVSWVKSSRLIAAQVKSLMDVDTDADGGSLSSGRLSSGRLSSGTGWAVVAGTLVVLVRDARRPAIVVHTRTSRTVMVTPRRPGRPRLFSMSRYMGPVSGMFADPTTATVVDEGHPGGAPQHTEGVRPPSELASVPTPPGLRDLDGLGPVMPCRTALAEPFHDVDLTGHRPVLTGQPQGGPVGDLAAGRGQGGRVLDIDRMTRGGGDLEARVARLSVRGIGAHDATGAVASQGQGSGRWPRPTRWKSS